MQDASAAVVVRPILNAAVIARACTCVWMLCFFSQLPEQVVGMATGSNITPDEKEAIARAVRDKRRLTAPAGEHGAFSRTSTVQEEYYCYACGPSYGMVDSSRLCKQALPTPSSQAHAYIPTKIQTHTHTLTHTPPCRCR